MARLPTLNEISALEATLEPYFTALGKVAHEWNHLHEELGKVFCAVTALDLSVGMAIWHSLKSDRSQRDILEGVVQGKEFDEDWMEAHPGAISGVLYLTKETNKIADRRNIAIHAPCHALPELDDFEIKPITFFGNLKQGPSLEKTFYLSSTGTNERQESCANMLVKSALQ